VVASAEAHEGDHAVSRETPIPRIALQPHRGFHVKQRQALPPEAFATATGADSETLARLRAYLALLEKWQRRINLVSASTLADPWRRHMLDSAQLVPLIASHRAAKGEPGAIKIADLGSGAGFPGLVLAILGAGSVCLIESDSRKSVFLREAIRVTAAPARVEAARIEDLPPQCCDVVTARACAPLPLLLAYAARHLAPEGIALLLKGRTAATELTEAEKTWKIRAHLSPSVTDPSGSVITIEAIRPR